MSSIVKSNFQGDSTNNSNYENYILISDQSPINSNIGLAKSPSIPQSFSLYSKCSSADPSQIQSQHCAFPVDPVQDYGFFRPNSTKFKTTTIIKYPTKNEKCVISPDSGASLATARTPFDDKLPTRKRSFDWRNNSTLSTSSTSSGFSFSTDSSNSTKDVINRQFIPQSSSKIPIKSSKKQWRSWKEKNRLNLLSILIVLLMALILILAALILILWLMSIGWPPLALQKSNEDNYPERKSPYDYLLRQELEEQEWTSQGLQQLFQPENIRNNLRWIASRVHVAGTPPQLELIDKLENEYKRLGFEVKNYEYEVLLSYPDYDHPNTLDVWNTRLKVWTEISNGLSEPLGPPEALMQQIDPHGLVWWNAYSPNGTVVAPIVYVNYGTLEDYQMLEKINITISGKIVLVRYGALIRGDKASLAQERGAVGVLIYSDLYDFAPELNKTNKTFPDQIWLPPSGAQRGTLLRTSGDPESPFLPSKNGVYRMKSLDDLLESGVLPRIPVTSIGYRDAIKIFRNMDGDIVPWSRWRGGMRVEYRISSSTIRYRLNVRNRLKRRRIKNFVALWYGREQPDKWVLLGNHCDSWNYGAIDPGTGTSAMLEVARVLTTFSQQNSKWRPRRTIAFCQWDAEEFGLIGSTEWIEEMLKLLERRAIAYINVDNINGNTTLQVKAVPLLYRALVDAASKVNNPVSLESETLLDAWLFHSKKGPLPGNKFVPQIQLPDAGSDFQSFISYAGIPVADLRIESAPTYSFMLYHSDYEIPWTHEKLIDPTALVTISLAKFWLEITRNLAESLIIPFNVEDYGIMLREFLKKMDTQLIHIGLAAALGKQFYAQQIARLDSAILEFQQNAQLFQQIIQCINNGEKEISLKNIEILNSRLQALEGAFIIDFPIGDETARCGHFRHVVFSPLKNENYFPMAHPTSTTFALILDPALKWSFSTNTSNKAKAQFLESVKLGFGALHYAIESATLFLKLDEMDKFF